MKCLWLSSSKTIWGEYAPGITKDAIGGVQYM